MCKLYLPKKKNQTKKKQTEKNKIQKKNPQTNTTQKTTRKTLKKQGLNKRKKKHFKDYKKRWKHKIEFDMYILIRELKLHICNVNQ